MNTVCNSVVKKWRRGLTDEMSIAQLEVAIDSIDRGLGEVERLKDYLVEVGCMDAQGVEEAFGSDIEEALNCQADLFSQVMEMKRA